MEFWIGVVSSFIAMNIYHWLMNRLFTDGTLYIDTSNPEKDVYRFKIDYLDDLKKKKRIVLKVDKNAKLSQD